MSATWDVWIYWLSVLGLVPASIVGIVRFRKILPADRPVIYQVWAALITEPIAFYLARTIRNNLVCYNIFELVESLLIVQYFHNWGSRPQNKWAFRTLQVCLVLFWLILHHDLTTLMSNLQTYGLLYNAVAIWMSLNCIGLFVRNERSELVRNGRFIVSVCAAVSAFYLSMQYALTLLRPNLSQAFYAGFFAIWNIVSLILNAALVIGILRLPNKERLVLG